MVLFLGVTPPVSAGESGDSRAGRQLAETWCSNCHVIGPMQERGTSYGAPTFESIARMTSITPMALRVFLQTPHSRMPDLRLSRKEIDDIVAYILSLRRGP
jgi:mono/diheme cytochrome c family protein